MEFVLRNTTASINFILTFDEVPNTPWNEKSTKYVQPGKKQHCEFLHRNKNIDVIINDTDKNVGPTCADKDDVINESTRQLYEKRVYNQLTKEEAEQLIRVQKKRLENVVNKHIVEGFCSNKQKKIYFRI